MQVKAQLDFILFLIVADPFFDLKQMGMKYLWRFSPSPIEVNSSYIASKIAIDDSIHVDHGIYLEDVVLE